MWVDQCINAFKMKVEAALWKGESFAKTIKKLATESNIPEDVLYSWFDGSYMETRKARERFDGKYQCRICRKNTAEISSENKRTYASLLCSVCRKKAKEAKIRNSHVTFNDGTITVCPRCNFAFLTKEEGDGS